MRWTQRGLERSARKAAQVLRSGDPDLGAAPDSLLAIRNGLLERFHNLINVITIAARKSPNLTGCAIQHNRELRPGNCIEQSPDDKQDQAEAVKPCEKRSQSKKIESRRPRSGRLRSFKAHAFNI